MRKALRAIREANSVLVNAGVTRAPVDVYGIAGAFADVVELKMDDSISGMLIPSSSEASTKRFAIVVNARHSDVRKRFTVAHELGHLILHGYSTPHADTGFKIRFRANREYDGSLAEEIEANKFAGELLMPTSILLARTEELNLEYVPLASSNDNEIEALAREFAVSTQALQIRLSDLI